MVAFSAGSNPEPSMAAGVISVVSSEELLPLVCGWGSQHHCVSAAGEVEIWNRFLQWQFLVFCFADTGPYACSILQLLEVSAAKAAGSCAMGAGCGLFSQSV